MTSSSIGIAVFNGLIFVIAVVVAITLGAVGKNFDGAVLFAAAAFYATWTGVLSGLKDKAKD